MTFKKLVKELCKREGLKKQVDVAQVTELLGHLADLFHEERNATTRTYLGFSSYYNLLVVGNNRAKKKAKKK